jgi:hypothetical protein
VKALKEKNNAQGRGITPAQVEVVASPSSIDGMLKESRLGYLHADSQLGKLPVADLVNYVGNKMEQSKSALRHACLFAGAVARLSTDKFDIFSEGLKTTYGTMAKDILSIGRALPDFEARGLSLNNVRDLYGLRDVRKIALGKGDEAAKAIALLNEGKPPRKVKNLIDGKAESRDADAVKTKPAALDEPKTETEKIAVYETQLIIAAERITALLDHDPRLKIVQRVVAKFKLAGWQLKEVK